MGRSLDASSARSTSSAITIIWALVACAAAGCGSSAPTPGGGMILPGEIETQNKSKAFASEHIRFEEITDFAGIDFVYKNGSEHDYSVILESLGGGVAVFDFDADGNLDLYFAQGGGFSETTSAGVKEIGIHGLPSLMLRGDGAGRFVDVTDLTRTKAGNFYSHGCHVGDYDADGFPDLLVTGYGGLQFFRNQGDGTFQEVTQEVGFTDTSWSTGVAWADFDEDGHLDCFVQHYVNWSFENDPHCGGPQEGLREICPPKLFKGLPDILYMSNGDGTFRDASLYAGLRNNTVDKRNDDGNGLGVIVGDVEMDGDLDIYVANDTTPNFLYVNDGTGAFEEVGRQNGVALDLEGESNGSMGVDIVDFDNDGDFDLWAANYEFESFALYRNQDNGYFRHYSNQAGISRLGDLFVGFGTAFFDADLDGDEDVVVANGHVVKYPTGTPLLQIPLLLENVEVQGQAYFNKVKFPDESYFSQVHMGRGLAIGDLDNDGRQDVIISNSSVDFAENASEERAVILRNTSIDPNHWLQVRLVGTATTRNGIGSILKLTTIRSDGTSREQLRIIKGGGTYLSQNDLRPTFGIPHGDTLQSLQITWPSKSEKTQVVTEFDWDQTLTIVEPREGG
ncbi:MAG: CRTAC1 family protein [Pirellulaceae bacterium]|nr:CRTAC1 family protein [Pirellulaceae bacterium]